MNQGKKLFGDRIFSDLIFQVPEKGKKHPVYAHSAIIGARCPSLLSDKDKDTLNKRKKKTTLTIDIKSDIVTPPAFHAMVEYLYTGVARLAALNYPNENIELYLTAEFYGLERLKWLTRGYLKEQLNLENVFPLLKAAHDYKAKTIKDIAMKFALDNYSAFIGNKSGVKAVGVDLFQEVVTAYATRATAAKDESHDAEPTEELAKHFKLIYDQFLYPDATAQTKTEKVRFHKAFLAIHSDAFTAIFRDKDEPSGGWNFSTITSDAFKALLRYLYYGEIALDPFHACELVSFSRNFELAELQKVCKHCLQNNINSATVVEILKQTLMPGMESGFKEVQEPSIVYAVTHLPLLDFKDLTQIKLQHAHYIACDLLFAYQKLQKGEKVETQFSARSPSTSAVPKFPSTPKHADKPTEDTKAEEGNDDEKGKPESASLKPPPALTTPPVTSPPKLVVPPSLYTPPLANGKAPSKPANNSPTDEKPPAPTEDKRDKKEKKDKKKKEGSLGKHRSHSTSATDE